MNLKYATKNKYGKIYKVINSNTITIQNAYTLFGIEIYKNNVFYIKWIVDNKYLENIKKNIESDLQIKFPECTISSCVIIKPNYSDMLLTKVINNNSLTIDKEEGDISTLSEFIEKKKNMILILL